MTIAQTQRDPWRAVWKVATSDRLLVALSLAAAIGLIIAGWLPQTPAADPIAYAQWLSETRARFGQATSTLQALGLYDVTRSFGFRAVLALLAACLFLRLTEGSSQLRQHRDVTVPTTEWRPLVSTGLPEATDFLCHHRYRVLSAPDAAPPLLQADRWPLADLSPLLAHAGALLLLAGLLAAHLWGWRIEGLIVQAHSRVTLNGAEEWIALDEDARAIRHSAGIAAFIEEHVPGIKIAALDEEGNPLLLQQTSDVSPVPELTVALAEDQYLAIPEAQLVVRLAAHPNHAPETRSAVLIQVYRSPPGRLETESVATGNAEVTVDNVTLKLTRAPHAQVTAVFNPGLWPSTIGLALLIAGLSGNVVWPSRRLWLRENEGGIEGAGDIPTALVAGREA